MMESRAETTKGRRKLANDNPGTLHSFATFSIAKACAVHCQRHAHKGGFTWPRRIAKTASTAAVTPQAAKATTEASGPKAPPVSAGEPDNSARKSPSSLKPETGTPKRP